MQNKPALNALILGGYGQAGQVIAAVLADRIAGRIAIAGRSRQKAEAVVYELQQTSPDVVSFNGLALDINAEGPLTEAAREHDVVIAAVPLDRNAARRLVDACVDGRADCVEISAGTAKYEVFEVNRDRIAASGQRFVIDAGADPGLPGWVARCAASQVEAPKTVTLFARYRAKSIGLAGACDILEQLSETPLAYDGGWTQAGWWTAKWRRFPGGFGRAVALPFYLNELEAIPTETGLEQLRSFHAGINPVTDTLTLARMSGLGKLVSVDNVARWFDAVAARFTPEPTGISLHATVEGRRESATVDLWHHDLYRATASIAVLATLGLHCGAADPGPRFLWQQVDSAWFRSRLEDMGLTLRIVGSPSH